MGIESFPEKEIIEKSNESDKESGIENLQHLREKTDKEVIERAYQYLKKIKIGTEVTFRNPSSRGGYMSGILKLDKNGQFIIEYSKKQSFVVGVGRGEINPVGVMKSDDFIEDLRNTPYSHRPLL